MFARGDLIPVLGVAIDSVQHSMRIGASGYLVLEVTVAYVVLILQGSEVSSGSLSMDLRLGFLLLDQVFFGCLRCPLLRLSVGLPFGLGFGVRQYRHGDIFVLLYGLGAASLGGGVLFDRLGLGIFGSTLLVADSLALFSSEQIGIRRSCVDLPNFFGRLLLLGVFG